MVTFEALKEQALRAELECAATNAALEKARREKYEASKARLRVRVLDFLAQEMGLERAELDAALVVEGVDDDRWPNVTLEVPQHVPIGLDVANVMGPADEDNDVVFVLAWNGTRPFMVADGPRFSALGAALLAAARLHEAAERLGAVRANAEAIRQARVAKKAQAAEEAQKGRVGQVAALLAACPPLGALLDVLLLWVQEHEQFAAELETANEWAASIEARMGDKLRTMREEARQLAGERDDLEYEKGRLEEQLREAAHQERRGW